MKKLLLLILCVLFLSLHLAQATTENPKDDVVLTFMRYGKLTSYLSDFLYLSSPDQSRESEFAQIGIEETMPSRLLPYRDLYYKLTQQLAERIRLDQILAKANNDQLKIAQAYEKSENMYTLRLELKKYPGLADARYFFVSEHLDVERFFQAMIQEKIEINSKNLKTILRSKFTTLEQMQVAITNLHHQCIEEYLSFIRTNFETLEKVLQLANDGFIIMKNGKAYALSPSEIIPYINRKWGNTFASRKVMAVTPETVTLREIMQKVTLEDKSNIKKCD